MTTCKRKALRLLAISSLLASATMTLGACASREEQELYSRVAFPERRAPQQSQKAQAPSLLMDPQDRGGGGAGGGGGGGGGH